MPASAIPLDLAQGMRMLSFGSPQEIVSRANRLTYGFNPSKQNWFVRDGVNRLVRDIWRPGRIVLSGGTVTTLATGKAFLGFNVGTLIASGSASAIGVAGAMVIGAAAASYGVGTLINQSFNLSDRLGDGLYHFFHGN